tara:strand:+ start:1630 stop:2103 length:474 start_codon:yes stop_codon:yes gene_type:complete
MSDVNNIPGNDDTIVTLTYEDRHEGWHSTGELESEAVNETFTADQVASVITDYKLGATTAWGDNNALDELREQEFLDDYERGDFDFDTYVAESIKENFYELDSLIETSIEQYDHKRGVCTVSSTLKTTLGQLKQSPGSVSGWTASVDHNGGTFSVDL